MNIFNKSRIINIFLVLIFFAIVVGVRFTKDNRQEKTNNSHSEYSTVTQDKLAVYIKDSEGEYVEYDGNAWPSGYSLNTDLSKCLDVNKNVIENAFTYADGVFKLTTNTTSYCYLYFDEITA